MLLFDGPDDASHTIVLAHGAGAPMDSPFMARIATLLAERSLRVVRFEFPYMQKRRRSEKSGPPDRMPTLQKTFTEVARQISDPARLSLGGKSMGGRVATMIADELSVRGVIALGYPFHPPKKPAQLRVAHLETLRTPCLIVQGSRDSLGSRDEIGHYALSPAIELHYIEDGDHSLAPRKASGRTPEQALVEAADAIARFVLSR